MLRINLILIDILIVIIFVNFIFETHIIFDIFLVKIREIKIII